MLIRPRSRIQQVRNPVAICVHTIFVRAIIETQLVITGHRHNGDRTRLRDPAAKFARGDQEVEVTGETAVAPGRVQVRVPAIFLRQIGHDRVIMKDRLKIHFRKIRINTVNVAFRDLIRGGKAVCRIGPCAHTIGERLPRPPSCLIGPDAPMPARRAHRQGRFTPCIGV